MISMLLCPLHLAGLKYYILFQFSYLRSKNYLFFDFSILFFKYIYPVLF